MRGKVLGFITAVFAMGVIGVVQLNAQAEEPGTVGSAPLCTVTADGNIGNTSVDLTTQNRPNLAFSVKNSIASVSFKVSGAKNCKVRLTNNSFHAPALDGKPWSKQIKFASETKVYTPGQYTSTVNLPKQAKAGMCFYQVDLTRGYTNVFPLIAYGHGTIQGCIKNPVAACESLQATVVDRDTRKLTAAASVKDGAKITGYQFTVKKAGAAVLNQTVASGALTAATTFNAQTPGTYTASVTAKTSEGPKSSANCATTFTIAPPEIVKKPSIAITKLVENKKYVQVPVDSTFTYQISVRNTGNVALVNAVVTDTPAQGITLISASKGTVTNNIWSHTVPNLAVGEMQTFTITAKVPKHLAGKLTNTACVNTPTIPGNNDGCDTADVDVPEEGSTVVCDPATGTTISVKESEVGNYEPVTSEKCKDMRVCVTETKEVKTIKSADYDSKTQTTDLAQCDEVVENPKAATVLPQTGPLDTMMQIIGATSLAGAAAYYLTSRR